jgi:5'-phosphate synthase pdxT subunit
MFLICSFFYLLPTSQPQVRTPADLQELDGIVLPGGESTAIGLIGTSTKSSQDEKKNLWMCLQEFAQTKPTWGTCAGMILLAEKCVGASAVIENGQSLIGGVDVLVCRNYFGSQISSFEMPTPAPPGCQDGRTFPGVFIRAPAILTAGPGVEILAKVTAIPCRQAAAVLKELERKIAAGENVVQMGVVASEEEEEAVPTTSVTLQGHADGKGVVQNETVIVLPGASKLDAREVICVARRDNLLCTAFHPELTDDTRWHEYFTQMVQESMHR